MEPHKENREHARFAHTATLICSSLNKPVYYSALKRNHGVGGLCFESKSEFQEGTVLNIWMKDYSVNDLSPEYWEGLRTMSIGEVKWSRKIHDADGSHFAIGFRYYDLAY